MSFLIKNTDAGINVTIPREFAVEEVDKFRKEIYQLISMGEKCFIFNFDQCEFIDSTGLGVLISIYKKCIEIGGSLKLYTIHPEVLKIFQLTRLDKVFEIYS